MTTTRTLKPGLLVSLSARISGGVLYDRKDLDPETAKLAVALGDAAKVNRWETTKVIEDPAEYDRATETRNKARRLIASVCVASDFGLLCPSSREFDLARAIEEARRMADEHNRTARRSFVHVYTITGRIAQDDVEAARAIRSEVSTLIATMENGIKAADPKAIREAANSARGLSAMLSDDAAAKVSNAIEEARSAARAIVKRVEKGGEVAARVVAECDRRALDEARAAFLDLDEMKPVEAMPVAATSVDFEAPSEKGMKAAEAEHAAKVAGDMAAANVPDIEF